MVSKVQFSLFEICRFANVVYVFVRTSVASFEDGCIVRSNWIGIGSFRDKGTSLLFETCHFPDVAHVFVSISAVFVQDG